MKLARRAALALATLSMVLTAVTPLSSCQRKVTVDYPVAAAFDGERSYSWTGDVPASDRIGAPAGQEDVAQRLRQELDVLLKDQGFEKVDGRLARFGAALYLGVEKDTRKTDPLFTVYPYERIERGHAVLTLTDVRARVDSPAWSGNAEAVLRVTEHGTGQDKIRWAPTDQKRSWPVDSLASALGDELP